MGVFSRAAAAAGVALLLAAGAATAASAATPGIGDVSDAMRYGASGPVGSIVTDLSGEDDEVTTVTAPFPINFFGTRSEGVCITTNGGFYPVPADTDSCNNAYDNNLENLAVDSNASMIAALAADLDLGACNDSTPDGWGSPCEIYFGTTTVSGRDAFVITWYRVPMYTDENNPAFSSTFQIVIIKRATGDDAVGWDFDIEFNFGTLTDQEDGYSAADPTSGCDVPDTTGDCRWGVGWANYDSINGTADAYELFATTPTADLIDSGAYPLVRNALNSAVLGRYSFGMVDGVTTGFSEPVLVTDAGPALAETGSNSANLAWVAAALVVAGSGLVMARRRGRAL